MGDVIHPELGTKKYRSIRLENGLTALLISDPFIGVEDGVLAAAAMAVKVGSLLDPVEMPGLSHFLEHMVFSVPPPKNKLEDSESDENESMEGLKDFVSEHAGHTNGMTGLEYSSFYLEVDPNFLEGALSRFSQLFISPPLDISSMETEIRAIDSEYKLYKPKDSYRLSQLRGHTSPIGHPFNRFYCGNKKTFDTVSKEILRQHAMKLFNEQYFGDNMKLTVIGQETLDVLEIWVRKFFNPVKIGLRTNLKPNFVMEPIWKADVLYGLLSTGDNHLLEVSWIIPPKSDNFLFDRPENYLIQLLGHEVKGSICALFKDKGWATSLVAKISADEFGCTSLGRLFIISIYLTNVGLEKKYQMVSYIYQYLQLMRGMSPAKWIMDEYLQIQKIEFDSLDFDGIATTPLLFAQCLSANMLDYPVKYAISGDYLDQIWNPKAIEDVMKHFTPKNMRLDLVSKSINATKLEIEPCFESSYIEEQIPLVFREEWNNTSKVEESLHLPAKNQFIPTSFHPRDRSMDDLSTKIIVDKPYMKIWYKSGGGLAHANFNIYLNDKNEFVKNHLMVKMFLNLLEDELSDIIFQGNSAGLNTVVSLCDTQVQLKINGYYEKLGLYILEIFEKFLNFLPTAKRFEVIKESLDRELKNNDLLVHSEQLLVQMISPSSHSTRNKLKVLESISFSDLTSFIPGLRSQIFIKGMFFGDILPSEATDICQGFQRLPISPMNLREREIFPCAKRKTDVKVKNKFESNSLAKVYFRIKCEKGQEARQTALLNLFVSIISDSVYNKLRIEEKLGYLVECETHLIHGVGFYVCVISSDYNPRHLVRRIYKFMNGIRLEGLSDKMFKDYKNGVSSKLPHDSGKTIWGEIVRESCIFDFYSQEKKELSLITKNDLIEWYKRYVRLSSPKCCSFVVSIWGCNTKNGLEKVKILRLRRKMKIKKQFWLTPKILRYLGKVLSRKR